MLTIEERMKNYYEKPFNYVLPMRIPVIMRLDGKCFHTFTKNFFRPFDETLHIHMMTVSKILCEQIMGAQIAYTQSDEISIFLHNYKKINSQAWFNNEIQKMVSISAGIASSYFSRVYTKEVIFDSRVFTIPESEVCNYFVWRQQDASRNSIQMCAQSKFSHKELLNKSTSELQEMMFQKDGFNWDKLDIYKKRGTCIRKDRITNEWKNDEDIPLFTQDRDYINRLLEVDNEK